MKTCEMKVYNTNGFRSCVILIMLCLTVSMDAQEKLPYSSLDNSETVREYSVLFYNLTLPVSFDLVSYTHCEMLANASGDLSRRNLSIPEDSMWMERSKDCSEFTYTSKIFPDLVINVSSMGLGRIGNNDYTDQYKAWSETIDITYEAEGDNWYVISGVGIFSGDIFYLRSENGEKYNTKIKLQYPTKFSKNYDKLVIEILRSFSGK
jgi:hypothetical protein